MPVAPRQGVLIVVKCGYCYGMHGWERPALRRRRAGERDTLTGRLTRPRSDHDQSSRSSDWVRIRSDPVRPIVG